MKKKFKDLEHFVSIAKPPPLRHAATWADNERTLPPGSPEPGRWRTSRTPFMVPFLAACSDPRYSTIVFCCGSQMGKTENILNVVGHRLTDGPFVPILLIFPTEKLSRSMSNDRFKKMIESTEILEARLEKGQANKVMEKFFAGIRCGFGYAGSATELSSHPAGLVMIDEIDRMSDVSGEGDPYLLAKARTKNYTDSKVVITSTPTLEEHSRIWSLWESGTMARWAWPCPHCDEYFVPEYSLLNWEKDADPTRASKTAFVACPTCGASVLSKHKNEANLRGKYIFCKKNISGEYINVGFDPPDNPTASFWASGLASPWQSFGDIAYVMATALSSNDPGTIQGAVNTYLGECYQLRGDAPEWGEVMKHAVYYDREELPPEAQIITMGVDVQKDLLYYTIRAYGYRGESWLLKHGEVYGETQFDQVWIELHDVIDQRFDDMPISRVFIDSGYTPGATNFVRPDNQIYKFCRLNLGQCYPSKGKDMQAKPIQASKIDVTISGTTIKGGLSLWHIDTDYFKRQLYTAIRRDPGDPFGWHIPPDVSEEYCRQITSEECITDEKGKRTWVKTREDNHFLDCEVLCDAAAYSAGVHNLPDNTPKTPRVSQQKDTQETFIPPQSGSFFRR